MTYDEMINNEDDFSMDRVIQISKSVLPNQYRNRPWEHVNHGVGLLSTDDQLSAYIVAYGEMHQMKCRLAFQNFPFKELVSNFEIVDWGCGQGVATLTLLDILKDREKINLVKKITLIEPSIVALKRAELNVLKSTKGLINIVPINKFLPGDGTQAEIVDLSYDYVTIHLFSNILDITEVDLLKLARIVANPNHIHYVMCMGPMNTNSYRIQQFCDIFNVKEYISEIDNPRQGYTSDTNHIYSCCTRCFKYEGGLSLQGNVSSAKPISILNVPIYDDYDYRLLVDNNVISRGVYDFNEMLRDVLDEQDNIYLKPDIGGDKPDIVVVRECKGILLVHVFEDDINEYEFVKDNNNPNKVDTSMIVDQQQEDRIIMSPISVIKSYQRNLVQLHIKDMLGLSLIDHKYWSLIKMVVYFPKNTTAEVSSFFKGNLEYVNVFGYDILERAHKYDFLKDIKFVWNSDLFDNNLYRNVLSLMSSTWHSYKQGVKITLTPAQSELSDSDKAGRHKINGVAGCGKTEVLVHRAVNAQVRTGRKVLILTFNLSLVNYIKYRMNNIQADFFWDNFYIINYHQFFKSEANNCSRKVHLNSFDDKNFFKGIINLKRYAAIFIDEVQDYKTEWLEILRDTFLEKDGEFIVFGDAKQNIYARDLGKNGEILLGVIPGRWNNSLNKNQRFVNKDLTSLIINFQKTFFKDYPIDNIAIPQLNLSELYVMYTNVGLNISVERLVDISAKIKHKYNIEIENMTILSQSCDILRDFEEIYCSRYHRGTMTTFETANEYRSLSNSYNHANDPFKDKDDDLFWHDIHQIRRNKKLHFNMQKTTDLKLSTIHSFKGWDSSTIILILLPEQNEENNIKYCVLEKDDRPALIYTAITRAKQNLFIINCGNEKYHEFFKNNCN